MSAIIPRPLVVDLSDVRTDAILQEQRERFGLTTAELALRAWVSPEYVELLELGHEVVADASARPVPQALEDVCQQWGTS